MKKNLLSLVGIIMLIPISLSSSLLTAYVVLSLSGLYEIGFITSLSFLQIYGALIVINVVKYKVAQHSERSDMSPVEAFLYALKHVFGYIVGVLFLWGFGYLMHYIIS